MFTNLYYSKEVKAKVNEVMLNEISSIIFEDRENWQGMSSEHKITAIESIFKLAESINKSLDADDEKEGE